jgi:hypothetical protein
MALANVSFLAGGETGNINEWDVTTSAAINSTSPITGNYDFKIGPGGGSITSQSGTYTGSVGTMRCRFNVSVIEASGSHQVASFFGATLPIGYVYAKATGSGKFDIEVQAVGGTLVSVTTGSALSEGTTYLLEARYTQGGGSNGKMEARIDGGTIGASTDGTETDAPTRLRIYGASALAGEYFYVDDVIQLDSSTLPGAGQIEALRPDGDSADSGEDEFQDEGGAAQTYDSVNQDPLAEAQYAIESSQVDADHRQLWTLTTIASVGTINHVRIGIQANRGNGSATEHRIRSKVSTPENSADLVLDGTSRYYTFAPTTQPSSQGELDSYQAGVWRNAGGREFNCYELWVMVDYTPSEAGVDVTVNEYLITKLLWFWLLVGFFFHNPHLTTTRRELLGLSVFDEGPDEKPMKSRKGKS